MPNYSGLDLVKQEQCKLTYATFLSDIVDCYDRVKNLLILRNPFFFETTYDPISQTLSNSAFRLRKVKLLGAATDLKPELALIKGTTGLELILKAGKYSKKQVIPFRHLTECDSIPCYNLPEDFGRTLSFCEKFIYKGEELYPCTGSSLDAPMGDVSNIVDGCETGYVCTEYGCILKDGSYTPKQHPLDFLNFPETIIASEEAIDYLLTPLDLGKILETDSQGYYLFNQGIGSMEEFELLHNGTIVAHFPSDYSEHPRSMRINLLNLFDYIQLKAYTDGHVTKTVDLFTFIALKYLDMDLPQAQAYRGGMLDLAVLLTILPSLTTTKFDWDRPVKMATHNGYFYTKPSSYVTIKTHVTSSSIKVTRYFKFTNNFIPSIYKEGLDVLALQENYDLYSEQVKWLISGDAYVYAVYQGYLDPSIPIEV